MSYLFIHSLCEVNNNAVFFGLTSRMSEVFIVSFKLKEGEISPVLVSNSITLQDPGILY